MKQLFCVLAAGFLALAAVSLPAADFDGDGTNDIAVFRPSNGLWAVRGGGNYYFGGSGDQPMPGDYDGDGTVDIAIFRPSNGLWAVRGGDRVYFGGPTDQPIPGVMGAGGGSGLWSESIGYGLYYQGGTVAIGSNLPGYAGLLIYYNSTVSNPQLHLYEAGDDYARINFRNTGSMSNYFALAGRARDDAEDARLNFFYNTTGDILTVTGDGKVGINRGDPAVPFDVYTNTANSHLARFKNDGNNANRQGIMIQCGSDSSGQLVQFRNAANTVVGAITFSGNTVTYGNFTAEHPAAIPEKADREGGYPYGTVVSLVSAKFDPKRPRQAKYAVEPSAVAYDSKVFGVYAGKTPGEVGNHHSIYAVGDGHVLVTSEGGDIEAGDYLTTSSRPGWAMRQGDDLRHSYTLAKALESVRWEEEPEPVKLIACTYQTQ